MQVERLSAALAETLAAMLVGIYVHGSLSMGCFNPGLSDIDLLVVISEPTVPKRERIVLEYLLQTSSSPCPVEITIVTAAAMGSGLFPVPYDLHYG